MKNLNLMFLVIVLTIVALCAIGTSVYSLDAEEEAVYAVVSSHYKGINKGNSEFITDLYSDDIVIMAPFSPATVGKENVMQFSKASHENVKFDFNYKVEEIIISGNWAFTRSKVRGFLAPRSMDVAVLEEMKGIHLLQKQEDGSWKIARFIFNPSTPLQ